MKNWFGIFCLVSFMLLAIAPLAKASETSSYEHGDLKILDPWSKSPIGSHEAKLFFEFLNFGETDELLSVDSLISGGPTFFRLVQTGENGRYLETLSSIMFPSTKTPFELSEIGYYIELTKLKTPVVLGTEFLVTLNFKNAGKINIPFTNRFHSPNLSRRIREAARKGDLQELQAIRDRAKGKVE